jgi:hypothetical protein
LEGYLRLRFVLISKLPIKRPAQEQACLPTTLLLKFQEFSSLFFLRQLGAEGFSHERRMDGIAGWLLVFGELGDSFFAAMSLRLTTPAKTIVGIGRLGALTGETGNVIKFSFEAAA